MLESAIRRGILSFVAGTGKGRTVDSEVFLPISDRYLTCGNWTGFLSPRLLLS